MTFIDRVDAGRKLAAALSPYRADDVVLYALPRGGVAVARPIAEALNVPIDLVITRKVGHPAMPEFAIAAVTERGPVVTEDGTPPGIGAEWFAHAVDAERREATRRRKAYLGGRERTSAKDKIAILVDDGLATGLTMRAAIREVRTDNPKKIIVAVPVAPADTYVAVADEADDVICLHIVAGFFGGVGAFYTCFPQLGDDEVTKLLKM